MTKSKRNIGLAAVGAVAIAGWAYAQQPLASNTFPMAGGSRELITYCLPAEGHPTMLLVVDPAGRHLAVYHINRDTGKIDLAGGRDIAGDLELDYFNSGSPLPEEIRNGLKRSQP